uniref:Orf56 n=1 Tax=Lactobacillus rhamnosus Lc-Nu-like prophage TaxID=313599 RepID=Q3L0R8_9CAUD|nr:Orf56 [Lactobacillus rhamnosus Lc-Nu-like prophage]
MVNLGRTWWDDWSHPICVYHRKVLVRRGKNERFNCPNCYCSDTYFGCMGGKGPISE